MKEGKKIAQKAWPSYQIEVLRPEKKSLKVDANDVVLIEITQNHNANLDRLNLTLLASGLRDEFTMGFKTASYKDLWSNDVRYAWIKIKLGYVWNLHTIGTFAIEKVTWTGGGDEPSLCEIQATNTSWGQAIHSDRERIFSDEDCKRSGALAKLVIQKSGDGILLKAEERQKGIKRLKWPSPRRQQRGTDWSFVKDLATDQKPSHLKQGGPDFDTSSQDKYIDLKPDPIAGVKAIKISQDDIVDYLYYYDNNYDYDNVMAKWHDLYSGQTRMVTLPVNFKGDVDEFLELTNREKLGFFSKINVEIAQKAIRNPSSILSEPIRNRESKKDIDLILPELFGSLTEAQNAIIDKIFTLRKEKEWLHLTLIGNPEIKPPCDLRIGKEVKITEKGRFKAINTSKFKLRSVTHTLDENGYITKVKATPIY
ncbi:MAG: hypothetical protein AAGN35_25605 [Bacteroidota bacterium]